MFATSVLSRRERRRRLSRLGLFVPFLVLAASTRATDINWSDEVSGLWSASSLWYGNIVPTANDVAYIGHDYGGPHFSNPSSIIVTLDTDVSLWALHSAGSINATNHSLTLALASEIDGAFDLSRGLLGGTGTLELNGATTFRSSYIGAGGTLTLNGSLALSGNQFQMYRDVVANGTTTWSHTETGYSSVATIGGSVFRNNGTFQVDGTGTNETFYFNVGFDNRGTLTQSGGYPQAVFGNEFTNSGAVSWAAGQLSIVDSTLVNTGLIAAQTGGTIYLRPSEGHNIGGTIRADGGDLTFAGNWRTFRIGSLEQTNGGRITFSAKVDNGAGVFDFSKYEVDRYYGAEIDGGTVLHSADALTGSLIIFDGAALDGGLDLRSNSTVYMRLGATFGAGPILLSDSTLGFLDPGATFDKTVTASSPYNGSVLQATNLTLLSNALVQTDPAATEPANLTLSTNGDLINQGTILANALGTVTIETTDHTFRNEHNIFAVGGTVDLSGPTFSTSPLVNTGLIRASQGGQIYLNIGVGWSNLGALEADGPDSRIVAFGDTDFGSLSTGVYLTDGGGLYLAGEVNAPGSAFNLGSFGPSGGFGLQGGRLNVGSIVFSDRLMADSQGTLGGGITLDKGLKLNEGFIDVDGSIDLGTGLDLTSGGLRVTQNTNFGGMARLADSTFETATVSGLSQAFLTNASALKVTGGDLNLERLELGASTATVSGDANLAVLSATDGDSSLTAHSITLGELDIADGASLALNSETVIALTGDLVVDGSITGAGIELNGGSLGGSGFVDTISVHGGMVDIGHSPGSLVVHDFSMDAASTFHLQIAGDPLTGLFDTLSADGTATSSIALDGTLNVDLIDGYLPTSSITWRFVNAGSGSLSGMFATTSLPSSDWSYGQDATGAFVSYASPVPEPATLAVLGLGLAAVSRRRKNA